VVTYLTLLSDASLGLYPNNIISSFEVRLPTAVELLRDRSCELAYPTPEPEKELQPVFVYCAVGGQNFPRCLRSILYPSADGYHALDRVYYVPVEEFEFKTVAIEVLTKLGERVPFPNIAN
jgi:hypothetical protein